MNKKQAAKYERHLRKAGERFIRREIRRAVQRGDKLEPIEVDDVTIKDDLPASKVTCLRCVVKNPFSECRHAVGAE